MWIHIIDFKTSNVKIADNFFLKKSNFTCQIVLILSPATWTRLRILKDL